MKAKYSLALFDLDGTLTDSGPGIMASVRYALQQMREPDPSEEVLRCFVGPPLFDSFTKLCGLSPEKAEEAIACFHKVYNSDGVFNNSVYPGIPDALRSLRQAGAALAVVTSKPGSIAKTVLDHFGLMKYFDLVSAADESDKGGGKETLINPVLKRESCRPGDTVMIGDTKYDAAGARKAGTAFLGVLYGFGKKEEMQREGGKIFVRTAPEIVSTLVQP